MKVIGGLKTKEGVQVESYNAKFSGQSSFGTIDTNVNEGKGYYFNRIVTDKIDSEKVIGLYLTYDQCTYEQGVANQLISESQFVNDIVCEYQIGDMITMINKNNFNLIGPVKSIDGNYIEIDIKDLANSQINWFVNQTNIGNGDGWLFAKKALAYAWKDENENIVYTKDYTLSVGKKTYTNVGLTEGEALITEKIDNYHFKIGDIVYGISIIDTPSGDELDIEDYAIYSPYRPIMENGVEKSRDYTTMAIGIARITENNIAGGTNCMAAGPYAIAFGNETISVGKNAFSAGKKNVSAGYCSVAFGQECKAIADESATFGIKNVAEAQCSFVTGKNNSISINGDSSLVFGIDNKASAAQVLVGGSGNKVEGARSVVFGRYNTVSSHDSLAAGESNILYSVSNYSIAFGKNNKMYGSESLSIDENNTVNSHRSIAIGSTNKVTPLNYDTGKIGYAFTNSDRSAVVYAETDQATTNTPFYTDPAFTAGSQLSFPSSYVTSHVRIDRNGSIYDLARNTSKDQTIDGVKAFAWYNSTINVTLYTTTDVITESTPLYNSPTLSGDTTPFTTNARKFYANYVEIDGIKYYRNGTFNANISAYNSFASGSTNQVYGDQSAAFGYQNKLYSIRNFAFGNSNTAYGDCSFVVGTNSKTTEPCSFAIGRNLITRRDSQFIIGKFNVLDTNAQFVVGVGSSESDRKNGFVVSANTGNGTFLGTVTASDYTVSGKSETLKTHLNDTTKHLTSEEKTKLQKIKNGVKIEFTSNNSTNVTWNDNQATFTHGLNCYPIVAIYDNNNVQTQYNVKILNGNQVQVNFEDKSNITGTWIIIVVYGVEYPSA